MKTAAVALALVPLGIIAAFGIGEGQFGWPHVVQLAVGLAFLAFAWFMPRWGGAVLAFVAVLLGLFYAVFPPVSLPLSTIFFVECLIYAPFVVSGVLFVLLASRESL